MNKKLIYIYVLSFIILMTSSAHAMDFILGARSGYFVWHPYFQDMDGSGVEELETGSGVLYGPAVSVIFNDRLSFSTVALFGEQSTSWTNRNTTKEFGPQEIVSTGNFSAKIDRIDIDTALSYRILKRFKVFVGYKYQYTETTISGTILKSDPVATDQDQVQVLDVLMEVPAHGPALGIGYSQTIGANFFFSCNLSGLYMFSKHKLERDNLYEYSAIGANQIEFYNLDPAGSGEEYKTQQLGLNLEPSVGMSISNVIATIGFRFQWVRVKFIDDPVVGTYQFAPKDWMDDFLYGIFVGVLYKI